MSTVTKAKKPARKPLARRPAKKKFPGMEISPVTGLFFKPLAPGQKPISREALKAALADSL
jgi:hypothetical protein